MEVDLNQIWVRIDNLSTNALKNFQVKWDKPDLIMEVICFPR